MRDPDSHEPLEQLYRAAAGGGDPVPWDRGAPHPLLEHWDGDLAGAGRRALVVGSGLGTDAEFLAACGFDVVAFDTSPTALALCRERFPESVVDYQVADLLDLPAAWERAFGFVLESLTVQSMAPRHHAAATSSVARMVAPGGVLLVIATARHDDVAPSGPPWPLTRAEIAAFADGGLHTVLIEDVREDGVPPRWRAEFRR
jgi:SAM-dependent methyltransferase